MRFFDSLVKASTLFSGFAAIAVIGLTILSALHLPVPQPHGIVAGASTRIEPTLTPTPTEIPVPVTNPARISIPKLNLETTVVPVGVTPENIMQTPTDFSTVGWFTGSPKPGDIADNASILTGHFDTTQGKPAAFFTLETLIPGDEIVITSETGIRYVFAVKAIESHQLENFPTEIVYGKDPGIALKLITCDGIWNPIKHSYSKRLVVTATLLRLEKFVTPGVDF